MENHNYPKGQPCLPCLPRVFSSNTLGWNIHPVKPSFISLGFTPLALWNLLLFHWVKHSPGLSSESGFHQGSKISVVYPVNLLPVN